jgi:hypothetical protein
MLTTAGRRTAGSPAPPSRPRLRLQPDLSAAITTAAIRGPGWPEAS